MTDFHLTIIRRMQVALREISELPTDRCGEAPVMAKMALEDCQRAHREAVDDLNRQMDEDILRAVGAKP